MREKIKHMTKQILGVIIAATTFVSLAVPSLAQQAQTIMSATDKQYLTKVAEGSSYEFQLAQLGVQKASDSTTQQYALRLLNDHAKFNTQLMQLAHQKGWTLPVEASSDDRNKIKRLMQLNGTGFDKAFAKEMVKVNTSDISESKREAGMTNDSDLKAFLTQFTPTDEEHLQGARSLMGGSATQS